MIRAVPMPERFARAVIIAELRRARRDRRQIDRQYLASETGFAWDRLERRISAARLDLEARDSAAWKAAEGGAFNPLSRAPQQRERARPC